jgi:broad specificity phosphatase PhoE
MGEPDFVIPGGESRRALQERGCAALSDIAKAGHEHAAVIAHGEKKGRRPITGSGLFQLS